VSLPEADDLDVTPTRFHEECEVERVGLEASWATRRSGCTLINEMDQLEVHQLLDQAVDFGIGRDVILGDEEGGLSLFGQTELHEIHEEGFQRRHLRPGIGP